MNTFDIGDRSIGPDEPTFIIAEAGSNHNGDLETAKKLIDVASDAGADAVKFQTFRADHSYVEQSGTMEYLEDDRPIYDIVKSMEMPYEWIPELSRYCSEREILFLSTPFDRHSAEELEQYVPAWKVASYTSSHHPFLRYLARSEKPVIMSTGAHGIGEIRESVEMLTNEGVEGLALLQCVAAYPTPIEEANVQVVETLADEFEVPVGLSDHTTEPTIAPAAAVALGANVVEKHFTLDTAMDGPDHQFALEPAELTEMVDTIRKTESALGTAEKTVLSVESELHEKARRAVHAVENISVGEEFTRTNVRVLRPGERKRGLHPKYYEEILGQTASRDIEQSAGVQWGDIKEKE
jgi:N-acetylneuraminate synthase